MIWAIPGRERSFREIEIELRLTSLIEAELFVEALTYVSQAPRFVPPEHRGDFYGLAQSIAAQLPGQPE